MADADAVPDVAKVEAHVADGVALLPSRLQKPDVREFVAALLEPAQDFEDAVHPLVVLGIDDASFHALTQIGALVGLPRLDASQIGDIEYRRALRAWIRAMRSSGTAADFADVLAHLVPDEATYTLREFFPASVLITPSEPLAVGGGFAAKILRATRAAGVGAQMLDPDSVPLRFASQHEEVEVDGDGERGLSDALQSQGGGLCGVVE